MLKPDTVSVFTKTVRAKIFTKQESGPNFIHFGSGVYRPSLGPGQIPDFTIANKKYLLR